MRGGKGESHLPTCTVIVQRRKENSVQTLKFGHLYLVISESSRNSSLQDNLWFFLWIG